MDKLHKIAKDVVLLTPTLISVVVLITVLIDSNSTTTFTDEIETKINMGLAIIGLAVTVWVGLNIYNLIEKRQMEELSCKLENAKNQLEEISLQMAGLESKIESEEKKREYTYLYQRWYKKYNAFHLSPGQVLSKVGLQKAYHNIDSYINSFDEMYLANCNVSPRYILDYSQHIKALLSWIIVVIQNIGEIDGVTEIRTGILLDKERVRNKINDILTQIKSKFENEFDCILMQATETEFQIRNYMDIKSTILLLKTDLKKIFQIEFDEQFDAINIKIDELSRVIKSQDK